MQSSVNSLHNDIGIQLKSLLDCTSKETESFAENNTAKPNDEHDELEKKLKAAREACNFAVHSKQEERAKENLDEVQKLEDELESLLD